MANWVLFDRAIGTGQVLLNLDAKTYIAAFPDHPDTLRIDGLDVVGNLESLAIVLPYTCYATLKTS